VQQSLNVQTLKLTDLAEDYFTAASTELLTRKRANPEENCVISRRSRTN